MQTWTRPPRPPPSPQLLPSLYHLKGGLSGGTCTGAIQDKLESMAGEVAQVLEEQLQVPAGTGWWRSSSDARLSAVSMCR